MFKKLFSHFTQDLAIDLGTANSLVYARGKGIIMNEPSVVAVNKKTGQILAIGEEAKKMVGRTPGHIQAVRPLVRGVVSDFEVTEEMLKYFIGKARQRSGIFAMLPRVIIGVPCGVTDVEKKAVFDAAKNAGAKYIYLIEEPVAAAIGARLPIQEARGNFVVDIGGGITEVAVISLGGIVNSETIKVAGDKLDSDIISFIEQKYKLLIGKRTAESVKMNIAAVLPQKENKEMAVRGRNLVTGLPQELVINSATVYGAIEKSVNQMIDLIKRTIENTPPELLSDIMRDGIYLSGGGALLRDMDKLISRETKMPVKIIEDPLTAVVRGGGIALESIDSLQEVLSTAADYQESPE
ncbi:rod shape-determining protein [bacterium]|nr:rod shape-determining protein [bacterium]